MITPLPLSPRSGRRGSNLARILLAASLLIAVSFSGPGEAHASGRSGKLTIRVVEESTGQPTAVRMHLKNSRGKAVKPPKSVFWHDHFVFDGQVELELPVGKYTFELERGPEHRVRSGEFTIQRGAEDSKLLTMVRYADLKKEGWWSGDLHIHRPVEDIELLAKAEDLHIAPVITWWNDKNLWAERKPPADAIVSFDSDRHAFLMAGEDEREGGAILYFQLPEPLPLAGAGREFPSPVEFALQARRWSESHLDVEKPFWWDAPLWVALGLADSIGICHNHMHRSGVLDNEAWGKPRPDNYRDTHANGRWTLDIYYHLLNCGLRLPPSAGSASGVLPNPVGYNRVYVHCGDKLTYDGWWKGLKAGQVFVTNGPLLRPRVNGQLPGHVFRAAQGQKLELTAALDLGTRDKIDYLEIVQDGKVVHEVRLDQWKAAGGSLPLVVFEKSGWMLVRAVCNTTQTFRFASTGPYYVEFDGKPRVSRRSAQFFADWAAERKARVRHDRPAELEKLLSYHQQVENFWKSLVDSANAE